MKFCTTLFAMLLVTACGTEQAPQRRSVLTGKTTPTTPSNNTSNNNSGNSTIGTTPQVLPSNPVPVASPTAANPSPTNPGPVVMNGVDPAPTSPAMPTTPGAEPSNGKTIADLKVLVFSKTGGYRHGDSIEEGIKMMKGLSTKLNFKADFSEDASVLSKDNLAKYNVVFFLNTTGEILDDGQKEALEAYVKGGGGWAGTHSAADTLYKWPFYGTLVGAWFDGHGGIVKTDVNVENNKHMSTAAFGATYSHADEWYNYKVSVRKDPSFTVLMSLDEKKYDGGHMGADHPITWCHPVEKGRSWYTGFGHTRETFTNPGDVRMIFNGILWAAGISTPYTGE